MTLSITIPYLAACLALTQAQADQPPREVQPVVRSQPFGELLTPNPPLARTISPPLTRAISPPPKQIDVQKTVPKKIALTPPELIARAMETPDGNALPGRGMSLVEALVYANTPERQLEVTHAYWQLVARVAGYNIQCRLVRRLDIQDVAAAERPILETAQASAAAAIEDARREAIIAQHGLAQAAMLPIDNGLPLPVDLPHVGTYHTHFDEIFSTKAAPPNARLIDRVLPIYCKAIEARGRAIAASGQAFDAALKDYRAGRGGIDVVVARADSLGRRHRDIVDSVCDYNHEIAEYAIVSLSRPVDGAALVSMLIKTQNKTPGSLDSFNVPATAILPAGRRPTLAPPRDDVRRLSHDEPVTQPTQNPLRGEAWGQPSTQQPLRLDPPDGPAKRLTPIK